MERFWSGVTRPAGLAVCGLGGLLLVEGLETVTRGPVVGRLWLIGPLMLVFWSGLVTCVVRSLFAVWDDLSPPALPHPLQPRTALQISTDAGRQSLEQLLDLVASVPSQHPAALIDLVKRLPLPDRRRLLCLAWMDDDSDTRTLAAGISQALDPTLTELDQLLDRLETDERQEIDRWRAAERTVEARRTLTSRDTRRIRAALRRANDELGDLPREEAVWICLPPDERAASVWIDASASPKNTVPHFPSVEEIYALRFQFRQSQWILHIHNHPSLAGYNGRPTGADKQFAACWSSIPPELSARMKFFVVRRGRVVEYGLADGGTLRWKI